jgi:hypothetical protein
MSLNGRRRARERIVPRVVLQDPSMERMVAPPGIPRRGVRVSGRGWSRNHRHCPRGKSCDGRMFMASSPPPPRSVGSGRNGRMQGSSGERIRIRAGNSPALGISEAFCRYGCTLVVARWRPREKGRVRPPAKGDKVDDLRKKRVLVTSYGSRMGAGSCSTPWQLMLQLPEIVSPESDSERDRGHPEGESDSLEGLRVR